MKLLFFSAKSRYYLLINGPIRIIDTTLIQILEKYKNIDNYLLYGDSIVKINGYDWYESRPKWSPTFASNLNYFGELIIIKSNVPFTIESLKIDLDLMIKQKLKLNFSILNSSRALYVTKKEKPPICKYELKSKKIRDNNTDTKFSIIIPTKFQYLNNELLLTICIQSLLNNIKVKNLNEIILVVHNLLDYNKAKEFVEMFKNLKFRILNLNSTFNYSKTINLALEMVEDKYVFILNDDIKFISKIEIGHITSHLQRDNAGAIGFKLLYPNMEIQHAGIEFREGAPQHFLKGSSVDYLTLATDVCREMSGATAACLFVDKDFILDIGGFDENFPNDYNDVDLSIRIFNSGKSVILCKGLTAIHFESLSRGNTKLDELNYYLSNLIKKHGSLPLRDPYLYTPFPSNY